jgi:CheY-like chemotaxis protein
MPSLAPVLLAEDNPNDVELTLAAMADTRIANRIDVVHDGADALDYLYRRGRHAGRTTPRPAVILLDLKMPKVDGLEVLQTIKRDPQLKDTPVVMLTSSREESDLCESYARGVNAYVVKPVDSEEFMAAIKKLGVFWALLNETPADKPSSHGPYSGHRR